MIFKSFVVALGVVATLPAAISALTITGPSASAYWVFNASNQITWTYNSGDPAQVSIVVTNQNGTFLNGAFSIAEYVPVSTQSFTVTNVTLNPGPGYVVNFVNATDHSQIFGSSAAFDVKPGGTPPASVPTPAAPGASGTQGAVSGTASQSGSASRSASSGAASPTKSSAAVSGKLATSMGATGAAAMALGVIGGALTFMF